MLTELSPSCFFTLGANETRARVPLSFFVVVFEGLLVISMAVCGLNCVLTKGRFLNLKSSRKYSQGLTVNGVLTKGRFLKSSRKYSQGITVAFFEVQ